MTSNNSAPTLEAPQIFAGGGIFAAYQEELQRTMLRSLRTLEVLSSTSDARVGETPKDVVWQQGTAALYRYRATTTTVFPVPLLMVHSLISKPYILDLIPGNSFVEYLVGRGFDVYLLDWGTPRPEDHTLGLDAYVLDMLPQAVARMLALSGAEAFSLFGYCLGGVLALLYAATHLEAPLRNLVTLATPVDFRAMGLQAQWGDRRHFDVDKLVDTLGNVPAELLQQSFRLLKPASEVSPVRYLSLWQNVLNDQYVAQFRAFDRWTSDHIPFAGEAFRQTVKGLVWENGLLEGTLVVGGQRIRLGGITASFLAVAAEQDHIVPLASTRGQGELVGSLDQELVVMPGGHVGLAAGRKAVQTLWPKVASWLAERSQQAKFEAGEAAEEGVDSRAE